MSALETQKTQLNSQGTAFTMLASKLGAVQSALETLTGTNGFSPISATSSNPDAVGVTAESDSIPGTYDVVVSQLAHAQVMASATTYSSPDQVVATGGVLTVAVFGNPPVTLPPNAISGGMTIRQLAEAINSQANSPVNAAIVQVAPGQYRLVLTGRNTGSANAFTVTSTLTGGAGVAFTDTDGDNTYGDSPADLAVAASDAQLTVNNVAVTSATNEVEGAIPGVTLTVIKRDPAAPVLVEISQSSDEAKSQLQAFVTAYNDLISFLGDQNTAAANGDTSIARDGMVRSLKAGLRDALQGEYGVTGGNLSRLSTIGLEFDRGGTISLDATKLSTALSTSYDSVRTLFAGAFTALKSRVNDYAKSGGLIQSAKDRLKDQIVKIDSRLETLQLQLDLRRGALQQEFIAADLAMTQLKAQGSSLQGLGSQYRLF
jgi:flagellar hook-associated protein 2